jgi:hypothetical protein
MMCASLADGTIACNSSSLGATRQLNEGAFLDGDLMMIHIRTSCSSLSYSQSQGRGHAYVACINVTTTECWHTVP